jgi:hypothetical protein
MNLALWLLIGFWGAVVARVPLQAETPHRITRGEFIVCVAASSFGPISLVFAAVCWIMNLGEAESGFFSRPLFRDERTTPPSPASQREKA